MGENIISNHHKPILGNQAEPKGFQLGDLDLELLMDG
jgi:hypothetical protein